MSENNLQNNIAEDIAELKKHFDQVKSDTEILLQKAKTLSDKGAIEAQDLLSSAKANWQNIVTSFEGSSIAKLFSRDKAATAKKASPKKKAKTAAKKPAMKAAGKKSMAKSTAKKAVKSKPKAAAKKTKGRK